MKNEVKTDGEGTSIVLPKGMDLDKAISLLQSEKEQHTYGDKEVTVDEIIKRFPFEAAYALKKAIDEIYTESVQHDVYLPDGSRIDAKLIGVPISLTETIQIPWGPFRIRGIEGEFETLQVEDNGLAVLCIRARIKRKYQDEVKKLAERTREIAEKESIYRGKSIKVQFRNETGELEVKPPSFMDLSGQHKVIFSKEVQRKIDTNLLIPFAGARIRRGYRPDHHRHAYPQHGPAPQYRRRGRYQE